MLNGWRTEASWYSGSSLPAARRPRLPPGARDRTGPWSLHLSSRRRAEPVRADFPEWPKRETARSSRGPTRVRPPAFAWHDSLTLKISARDRLSLQPSQDAGNRLSVRGGTLVRRAVREFVRSCPDARPARKD